MKRALYYCSRLISSQYGTEFTEGRYEKIKKVYSIWICANPPENRKNTITRYHMTESNLVGNVREPKANYDLLTVVMLCIGEPEDDTGRRFWICSICCFPVRQNRSRSAGYWKMNFKLR